MHKSPGGRNGNFIRRVIPALIVGLALVAGCSGDKCGPKRTAATPGPAAGSTVAEPAAGSTTAPAPEAGATAQVLPGSTAASAPPPFEGPFKPAVVIDSDTAMLPDLTPYKLAGEDRARDLMNRGEGAKPPPAPVDLKARPIDNFQVLLTWTDRAGGALYYQVDRSAGDGPWEAAALLGPNSTELIDGPLPVGSYRYRVRSVTARGASPYTGSAALTVAKPAERPLLPENLTAEADTAGKVFLEWSCRSNDIMYWLVERAEENDDFIPLGLVSPKRTRFTDAEKVKIETSYSYQVTAVNPAGKSEASEISYARVMEVTEAPVAPYELQSRAANPNSISLLWKDGSEDEDGFLVERKVRDQDKFYEIMDLPRDTTNTVLRGLPPGEAVTVRVRAYNLAGRSEPTAETTAVPFGQALASYIMKIDPAGKVEITGSGEPGLPTLAVWNTLPDGDGLSSDVALINSDPNHRLENAYVLVRETDQRGIFLPDCDRGPAGCSLDQAEDSGVHVGYQYTAGGFEGRDRTGAETEVHRVKGRTYPVRDVWPACGRVKVRWRIHGVNAPTTLKLDLIADRVPADFSNDSRYDPQKMNWTITPYTIGLNDKIHEPGAAENPTARPVNRLKSGEVFAVNVAVEAGNPMELEAHRARPQDDPQAYYDYFSGLGFALTYDPAVVRPISSRMVMPDGNVLLPGLRDPLVGDRPLTDGWSIRTEGGGVAFYPDDGWVQALFFYPPFLLESVKDRPDRCVHCGQEGFLDLNGAPQGPDREPEIQLGLIYFQVVGPPGAGTPLRLAPRPETYVAEKNTNGTVGNMADDSEVNPWREVNPELPPTGALPGEYQVRESYFCAE